MRFTEERVKLVLIALTIVGTSGLALAQVPKTPAEVIPYRQQQLKQLGGAFKAVNDETRAPMPNLDTIRTNSATISKLAGEFPSWFPAGSGPEAGVKTAAKPEIWTNPTGFAEKVSGLQTGAQGLATASTGTDVAAITAAVRAAGGACGACHREFRVQAERPGGAPPPPAPAPKAVPERG